MNLTMFLHNHKNVFCQITHAHSCMCGWMVHACLIHYSLLHRYKGHSSTLRFGGLDCLNERLGSCDEGRGELIEGTCDVYCGVDC